jgi:hypothetical protein
VKVEMKVKSTPSFFLYRNGQLLHSFSGIKNNALKTAIMERLPKDAPGMDWKEPPPPTAYTSSDSDDD